MAKSTESRRLICWSGSALRNAMLYVKKLRVERKDVFHILLGAIGLFGEKRYAVVERGCLLLHRLSRKLVHGFIKCTLI